MSSTRQRVLALYKELHRLGRDYPDPKYSISISLNMYPPEAHVRPPLHSYDFNARIRRMFDKNRALTDPAEIEQALRFGEYIKNETLALYSLRKYRYLKQRYDRDA
jgi:hypothetical protein